MLIICILTGIADSGSGVGILVFAPLTTVLLEAYGWKGTHLVFGGLSLGSILFASLMGPIRDAKIPGSFQSFNPGIFWKFQSRDFLIPG